MDRGARQHDGRQRAVGAAVQDDLDVLEEQCSILFDAGAVPDDSRMTFRGGGEILMAVVDQPHGPPRFAGEQRRVNRHDRGVFLLPAESTAGLGLHDDRLFIGQVEGTF